MTSTKNELVAFATHRIRADAVHTLAVAEYGNPQGIPVVFLHGGPGSGCRAAMLQPLFDWNRFRVIAPDQRGAGQSEPKGCLTDNTTQNLIADLEMVRERLDIPRWLVVGGSWGALLAVAYAQAHPERVSGVVVRSFFFGDAVAMRRAFIDTPKVFYPELHAQFIDFLPAAEREQPMTAYYRRILHSDATISVPATHIWHDYERALSSLKPTLAPMLAQGERAKTLPDAVGSSLPNAATDNPLPNAETGNPLPNAEVGSSLPNAEAGNPLPNAEAERPLPSTPRMEAHYFSNESFLKPNQLIDDAARLNGIRGVFVQGRYDLLCPPIAAYQIATQWRDAEVVFADVAGHGQSEPGVAEAMAAAIDRLTANK